jgi:hypothetical protein
MAQLQQRPPQHFAAVRRDVRAGSDATGHTITLTSVRDQQGDSQQLLQVQGLPLTSAGPV